ncbi:MAG: multicopper oxidase family protein [Corynebacterium flavescens]|uniref:multicopper oxidase family protein n=1 Tax=Corynebacterium flavescens TaxID=28028 RepID=UPI003F8DB51B
MRRRQFLRVAVLSAGVWGVGSLAGCGSQEGSASGSRSITSASEFSTALPVPPLLEAARNGDISHYSMRLQAGTSSIVPAGPSTTWGINGPFLGPTLRLKQGEKLRVDVKNDLPETTSLHWHGMRVPADADGGPHSEIAPGETWSPEWTVDQPAATLWYHPHPHGKTESHVYKGLGGFIIVDDTEEPTEFPHEYGVDDFPVIIQDKSFDESGELVEANRAGVGMLGNTILTNGTHGAHIEVGAQRIRLRLLNGSTARTYCLGLTEDRTFELIATDGGRLAAPLQLDRILLSPGERAEILVSLNEGDTVRLRSFAHDLGVATSRNRDAGAEDEFDVLELQASSTLRAAPALPPTLPTATTPKESSAAQTREFLLGDNTINGESMDMSRIDAVVAPNTVEIWEVENTHSQPHNFHIHDVQFRILDIDGTPSPPDLAGPKDTVYTPPGVRFRLIMEFGENRAPEIPYMFHCHLLWHEDEGMMGQFSISEGTPPPLPAHHQH